MNKIRVDGAVKVSSVRGDAEVWPLPKVDGPDSRPSSNSSETTTISVGKNPPKPARVGNRSGRKG